METIYEIQRIKQVVTEKEIERKVIRSPEDGADIARHHIGDDDREVLFVMCLNSQNEVVAVHRAHIGTLNMGVVHPRDVFKSAILNNSAAIIVAHQHPSSCCQASQEDIHVTKRLVEAGKMIGIDVLDHFIIGGGTEKFLSFKDKGYI